MRKNEDFVPNSRLEHVLISLEATRDHIIEATAFDAAKHVLSGNIETRRQQETVDWLIEGLRDKQRMSATEIVERGMFGYKTLDVKGATRIPQTEPLFVLSNHDNEGPFQGFAQVAAVTHVVETARKPGQTHDGHPQSIRWIQAARSENTLLKLPILDMMSELVNTRIGECFLNILVDRENGNEHTRSPIQIVRTWRRGGVVGLHPEGDVHNALKKIDPRALELLDLIARLGDKQPWILPITSWSDKTQIHVRVGNFLRLKEGKGELVMEHLASLLPPHKRGYYA